MEGEKKQFAVLIDADNISSKYAETIFSELEVYGFASCRRIYGNWSKGNGWNEKVLLENSIIPIQQFAYTSGKNSADMAMVIDAMDLLYSRKVDGFCLVTSDSDFTRLAMRLREEKMFVIGMGESKTPVSLTKACNRFVHLNLIAEASDGGNATPISEIGSVIMEYINSKGDEPAELSGIGSRLNERFTDFDVRNYGYTKLRVFVSEAFPNLEVKMAGKKCVVCKKDAIGIDKLTTEIVSMIKRRGGTIDNLSLIHEKLKAKHPDFDLKDYGYSRMSSFLRTMKNLEVVENSVKIISDEK